jgi:hypothetical protein
MAVTVAPKLSGGRLGDWGTGGLGEGRRSGPPSRPVSRSPSLLFIGKVILFAVLPLTATAAAQLLSDLETERPLAIEDARPVSFRAFSGSADWTYNVRQDRLNDYGPGFSLLYGMARGLELGGSVRYVTRPGRNAQRGISSGDIVLHALYQLKTETPDWPALAVRAGVEFPTGLDSKGTDLHLAGLATRSFETFRIHGNFLWTRLGATGSTERSDRFEGIVGADCVVNPHSRGTDTLLLADVDVSTNPVRGGSRIVAVEAGIRQRIGVQTIFFVGAGSELTGERDRAHFRVRVGLTHVY